RAGDVITFRPPGHTGLVTHRIHTMTTVDGKRGMTTKSEPNRAAAAWGSTTLAKGTQARVASHLPYLGYGLAVLSEKKVRMLVIGLPALLIAPSALAGLWRASAPG